MDVIHLGANKTASTLLQRKLFLELEDRFFIGEESNSFGNVSGNEFISSIIYSNSDELNASETYQCIQNKIFTCKNQRIPIILSSEDLISYGNQSLNAHRLQMLLPQANILLIIRNQIQSILSWYISHGSRLRNVPKDYWQRYVAPEQAVDFLLNFPQFTIERSFNYLGIYKIYSDLFGKDRVFCVPYELLNANNNLFFSTLSKALDVSPSHLMNIYARTRVRERRSYWHLKLHSIFVNYNSLLRCTKIINLLDRLYPGDFNHIFSEQTKRQIWDKYKVQNAELSDMIGYDLKSLGYPQ